MKSSLVMFLPASFSLFLAGDALASASFTAILADPYDQVANHIQFDQNYAIHGATDSGNFHTTAYFPPVIVGSGLFGMDLTSTARSLSMGLNGVSTIFDNASTTVTAEPELTGSWSDIVTFDNDSPMTVLVELEVMVGLTGTGTTGNSRGQAGVFFDLDAFQVGQQALGDRFEYTENTINGVTIDDTDSFVVNLDAFGVMELRGDYGAYARSQQFAHNTGSGEATVDATFHWTLTPSDPNALATYQSELNEQAVSPAAAPVPASIWLISLVLGVRLVRSRRGAQA